MGLWGQAVEFQLARVLQAAEVALAPREDATVDDVIAANELRDILVFESHFLLMSIHRVRAYAKAISKATGDHRIRNALDAFDHAAPDTAMMRDYVMHLEEYLAGGGNKRGSESLRDDEQVATWFRTPDLEITLAFGRSSIQLRAAAGAAVTLADAVQEVWWELVDRGQTAWRRETGQRPIG